jgi:general stress protein YciG
MKENNTKKRGFGSMSPEKKRQIASMGGKAAHANGTAHKYTHTEAVEAGKKGGKIAHELGRAHKWTSETASLAGKKGGRRAHELGRAHQFTSEEASVAARIKVGSAK